MVVLALLASLVYLAVGLGFASLSLHELVAGGRAHPVNRLLAWSGVVLWLPMFVAVAVTALFLAVGPTRQPPSVASADALSDERRAFRRAVRQA